jgi:hypothetical protein
VVAGAVVVWAKRVQISTTPAAIADLPENMANLSCILIHLEAQGAFSSIRPV